jgi:sRNA-binding regulator protein Hfq
VQPEFHPDKFVHLEPAPGAGSASAQERSVAFSVFLSCVERFVLSLASAALRARFALEVSCFMTSHANPQTNSSKPAAIPPAPAPARTRNRPSPVPPFRLTAHSQEQDPLQRQAELFYLQKQIQAQTPMVLVLEDGEQIEGCIEWYDRNTLKVRGHAKTLVYKSAIKYMYKKGDSGR